MPAFSSGAVGWTVGLVRRQRLALLSGALLWFGAMAAGAAIGVGEGSGVETNPAQPGLATWWHIFSANASVALLAFGGVLTLGIFTLLFTLVSGTLTGLGLGKAYAVAGPSVMAAHVLPHAVVELPAIAVAVGAGIAPLPALIRHLTGDRVQRPHVRDVLTDSTGLLCICLALLLVAATIETWVSTL
ncbi:stage II sporulation protein M [Streptomyces sp. NBC_00286]|uniref:stage II sporulation protein M n=1 Tax=Streptomyces sp. NBC_00286 TaxID=2975701 RepID=UPI002E27ABDB|nr:stage II sporulation protein M [Streptomyces sp. NBC_00286]